ncbi:MAG: hypothetical protein G01um101418_923 [Parcubacteria group bacterium Gr01-1014_18]|nr:MAG: hypothetical protein Greene041636_902 [Parcubacteria group bacterium Greene0416_36]TSC79759.1 MAG: hypothetical protein G01um101418_923 [Parcubacteria group bacterium Gr01-1014_18]TSC97905.1 MAG: hypothetical protein Greene101420_940 [Parcubacteria group bacterium Greene1014_20]TSD06025.1 MAG: hypothetical protein Greene07142_956 [Parcubacteria group bacterium Greene0714_2]
MANNIKEVEIYLEARSFLKDKDIPFMKEYLAQMTEKEREAFFLRFEDANALEATEKQKVLSLMQYFHQERLKNTVNQYIINQQITPNSQDKLTCDCLNCDHPYCPAFRKYRKAHLINKLIKTRESLATPNLSETLLAEKAREMIDIPLSLQKLENRGYGICEDCLEYISKKRLEKLPEARRCLECQTRVDKK